jgi:hypothetical protein
MRQAAGDLKQPTICVAMTVCNGLPFLVRQLNSILDQTVMPDEIVVADDASTDGSSEYLETFAKQVSVPVRLMRSAQRQGLRKNVEALLSQVFCDVVVLADQDDVWHPSKLDVVRHAFSDPATTLWFSNARLVDAEGADLGRTTWDAVHLDDEIRRDLETGTGLSHLMHGQLVTGATMAIRHAVLDLALPLPVELGMLNHPFLHDGWLAVVAATQGAVVADPEPRMDYRQHQNQFTQMSMATEPQVAESQGRRGNREQLLLDTQRLHLVLDRLRDREVAAAASAKAQQQLALQGQFLEVRCRGGIVPILGALLRGDYRKYARMRSAGLDLMRLIRSRRLHGEGFNRGSHQ